MAGLLVKELMVRGELRRCPIVAPGSLVEQWQDELLGQFGLELDILSRGRAEASRTGNPHSASRTAGSRASTGSAAATSCRRS